MSTVRQRKTIAEPMGDGWWMTLDDDGVVCEHPTAVDVVGTVRQRDRVAARRGVSTFTTIEWRNVPAGFSVPS